MITGQIVFNGLTDDDIIALLEIKKRHPNMAFNPTTLQAAPKQPQTQPPHFTYNNATFAWSDEGSLGLVREILSRLTEKQP